MSYIYVYPLPQASSYIDQLTHQHCIQWRKSIFILLHSFLQVVQLASKCYFSTEPPILPLLLEPILDLIRPSQCSWEYGTTITDAQMP